MWNYQELQGQQQQWYPTPANYAVYGTPMNLPMPQQGTVPQMPPMAPQMPPMAVPAAPMPPMAPQVPPMVVPAAQMQQATTPAVLQPGQWYPPQVAMPTPFDPWAQAAELLTAGTQAATQGNTGAGGPAVAPADHWKHWQPLTAPSPGQSQQQAGAQSAPGAPSGSGYGAGQKEHQENAAQTKISSSQSDAGG